MTGKIATAIRDVIKTDNDLDQLISILLDLAVQEEEGNHDDADTV